ncbi:MAG: hypothetical protein CNE89_02610 [Sphingomonadaceae bacterium MED-G03]|nr:MAG: hypothetical protein CNE89_02610 [Sphingomonadaceae bacterium MED-G03]
MSRWFGAHVAADDDRLLTAILAVQDGLDLVGGWERAHGLRGRFGRLLDLVRLAVLADRVCFLGRSGGCGGEQQ